MTISLCEPTTVAAAAAALNATAQRLAQTALWSSLAMQTSQLNEDNDHRELARWLDGAVANVVANAQTLTDACATIGPFAESADRYLGLPGHTALAVPRFDLGQRLGVINPALRPHDRCIPAVGDLGGTGSSELRSRWATGRGATSTRGREVLIRALEDTANGCQIGPDEIGLVQTGNRWLLVLPGVTDLSDIAQWAVRPSKRDSTRSPWGLNPVHRSVRDTDAVARRSATSASVADDGYAALVAELVAKRVPAGAQIAIVGHSAGADAALDLAADRNFNGAGRYSVTHVAAFAYYSRPMLTSVPAGTKVLAVENSRDLVVRGEQALSTPNRVLEAALTAADGDPVGGYRRLDDAARHGIEQLTSGARLVIGNVARDLASGRAPSVDSLLANHTRSSHPTDDQTHIVFRGGGKEAGHHQRHYIDFLSSANGDVGADVDAFASDLAIAGYAVGGEFSAVDVSLPAP